MWLKHECVILHKLHYILLTGIAKIIEVVGTSEKGWSEAAMQRWTRLKRLLMELQG